MSVYFSVIVPVYRVEQYLRACVDSILAQTMPEFELILVDDASPDGCPAICDEYAARDGRVIVIHKENGGVVAARKAGLDRARADYVCFVDSDDYVAENWLETLRRCIEENDRPDMVIHGLARVRDGALEPQPPEAAPGLYDKAALERDIYPYMLSDGRRDDPTARLIAGYIPTKAYRRELVTEHYVSDTRITLFEDMSMVYECLYYAESVYICPDCLYYYLVRPGSAVEAYRERYFRVNRLCYDYIHSHLGVLSREIDLQLNRFITYETIQAIYHEFRFGHSLKEALSHVPRELHETGLAGVLRFEGLPLRYKLYLIGLKSRMYSFLVIFMRLMHKK